MMRDRNASENAAPQAAEDVRVEEGQESSTAGAGAGNQPDSTAGAGSSAGVGAGAGAADEGTSILAEYERLQAEKAELYERLLRRQAEFENYRKRTERERAEYLSFAGMDAVRELLPIVDDFERGLKVESIDSEYAKGMELIYQRLMDTLAKLGVEPVQAVGQPFDPNFHHAIDRQESGDVEPDTVVEEFQKGYRYKGKLLRPSIVKVSV
jgi:molecular chaperone GrpE